jgi:hypothetical protein
MRRLNGFENRTSRPAQARRPKAGPWHPPGEEILQQARDFLGTPAFGLRPHFGFACEINDRQFALHNDLQVKRVMKSKQLLVRDKEEMGVNGSRGMRRGSCDQPNRYAGKNGGSERRE